MPKEKQQNSFEEVLSKLMRYCAYQERSELEVRQRALELGATESNCDRLLKELKKEKFIENRRFAELYLRGKVNQKRWGKFKIIEGLRKKGISQADIDYAFSQMDHMVYENNLKQLIEKKIEGQEMNSAFKAKVFRYLTSKGYESSLVLEFLN